MTHAMKRIIIITVTLLFGAHIEAQQLTEIYYNDQTGVVLELCTNENGSTSYILSVPNNDYLNDTYHLYIHADIGDRFDAWLNLWDIDRFWSEKKKKLRSVTGNWIEPYSKKVCRLYEPGDRCGDLTRKDLKGIMRALKKFKE